MLYQKRRKFAGYLPRFDLVGKFGKLGESVGGDQPDLAGTGIGNADQIEIDVHIPGSHRAQSLAAERDSLLRRSFRLVVLAEMSREGMVEGKFELAGNRIAIGLTTGGAHLQVLRGNAVVSSLRGLQKSQDGI